VGEPQLVVDVDGFEGPLDLLLELARRQKVDLTRISILALADQYLIFIEAARKLRLELAADYLVMAAWLAYLKSRLLLPEKNTPEAASAADLASDLVSKRCGSPQGAWPNAISLGVRFSRAACPNRPLWLINQAGMRHFTICCKPMPSSVRNMPAHACMCAGASSGRWPMRARPCSA
jgi:hypothetical protein